ncbi:hypothetical protein AHF37_07920 [Paragonimus kellicotti]|nr:hypothetical protein AHF37_07920 [Paragonimus kellicotti]
MFTGIQLHWIERSSLSNETGGNGSQIGEEPSRYKQLPGSLSNGRGNVTVSFREPPGEVVARIEARDPDEGHNALLHYSLISGNRNAVFRLGSTSAELIIDRDLDEADIGTYTLDILIQDAGVPPRSAQVQLTVKVSRKINTESG